MSPTISSKQPHLIPAARGRGTVQVATGSLLLAFTCIWTLHHSPECVSRARSFLLWRSPNTFCSPGAPGLRRTPTFDLSPKAQREQRPSSFHHPWWVCHLSGQNWRVKHLRKHYFLPNKSLWCQFLPFKTQPRACSRRKTPRHAILCDSNPIFTFRGGHRDKWAAQKAEDANINPPVDTEQLHRPNFPHSLDKHRNYWTAKSQTQPPPLPTVLLPLSYSKNQI